MLESAEQRKARKTPIGYRKYVYFPTLGPAQSCRLTVLSVYEKSEVFIECSKEFADMLREYAEIAKTYEINEEEDYEE